LRCGEAGAAHAMAERDLSTLKGDIIGGLAAAVRAIVAAKMQLTLN